MPVYDWNKFAPRSLSDPGTREVIVTAGTEAIYAGETAPRALQIVTAGTLHYLPLENADTEAITRSFEAGVLLPVRVRKIFDDSTCDVSLIW